MHAESLYSVVGFVRQSAQARAGFLVGCSSSSSIPPIPNQPHADLMGLEKLTLADEEALCTTFTVHNTPVHCRSTLAQIMGQFDVHGSVRRISPTAVGCRRCVGV